MSSIEFEELIREPDLPSEQFFSIIDQHMNGMFVFSAIITAAELALFDHLSSQITAAELASRTNISQKIIGSLLEILVSCGLLSKSGEGYQNTRLSDRYLRTISPYSQVHYLKKAGLSHKEIWADLPFRIRAGPLAYDRETYFREISLPAMAENALCGRLQRTVREICALPQCKLARKLLDLGGGHGLYAIALVAANPGLNAYVFDLPDVIPLTRQYIKKYHAAAEVFTVEGNFFEDSIGSGYDIIFSSSNPSGKSVDLLPKISSALNSGGLFVNVQSDDSRSGDLFHSLEWQLWTIDGEEKGQGKYSREQPFMTPEYRDALEQNGFIVILERDIKDDYHADSFVRMVVAKKEK